MNKKAFITGGSHGIGKGIARELAKNGYDIAITYNARKDGAEQLHEEITKNGGKCFYYQASLDVHGVAEEVTAKAIEDLGGLDLLVCNAGRTIHTHILDLNVEHLDFLYNLNYRSHILCSKIAANYMVENKIQGNIIFITSTRSLRAYPEDCIYGGLKSALNRTAESLAIDLSHYGIRVNCIAPGLTNTEDNPTMSQLQRADWIVNKIPLGRSGTSNEVGRLVCYIASDDARYMTGDIIKLDGGLILPGTPEK